MSESIVIRTSDGRTIAAVDGGRIGPDEVVRDSHGRPIDEEYVEGAVDAAVATRGRGRPSLHGGRGASRSLVLRIDDATLDALKRAAAAEGVSAAHWVRDAVHERLNHPDVA